MKKQLGIAFDKNFSFDARMEKMMQSLDRQSKLKLASTGPKIVDNNIN